MSLIPLTVMSSPEKAPLSSEQTAAASDHPVTNVQISGHVASQTATYPTQKQTRKQVTFITNDSQPSLDVPGKEPSSLSTTDTNASSATLSKANAQDVNMQSILSAVEQPSHVAAVAVDVSTSKLRVMYSCSGPTDAMGAASGGTTWRSQSQGSGNVSSSSSGGSGTSNNTSSRRSSIPRSKSVSPCTPKPACNDLTLCVLGAICGNWAGEAHQRSFTNFNLATCRTQMSRNFQNPWKKHAFCASHRALHASPRMPHKYAP